MSEIKKFFDELKDHESTFVSLFNRPGRFTIHEVVSKLDPEFKIAADFGCGPGYFLACLYEADRIHAVDFSEKMLEEAKSRAPINVEYHAKSLLDVELPEKVDLALCVHALTPSNDEEAEAMLKNMMDALSDHGALVLVVPSLESREYVFEEAKKAGDKAADKMAIDEKANGYLKNKDGLTLKYWRAPEMEELIKKVAPKADISRFEAALEWSDFVDEAGWQKGKDSPWAWGWVIIKGGKH